jgi:hypothetical protein
VLKIPAMLVNLLHWQLAVNTSNSWKCQSWRKSNDTWISNRKNSEHVSLNKAPKRSLKWSNPHRLTLPACWNNSTLIWQNKTGQISVACTRKLQKFEFLKKLNTNVILNESEIMKYLKDRFIKLWLKYCFEQWKKLTDLIWFVFTWPDNWV